ncbi:DMT family transporter [Amaricoccus tamworthensis]|uniref:DMT family transporter n=1 Tax=Amaricoccus tamworthensis TaxID=57002 RepID=UPI003C7B789E
MQPDRIAYALLFTLAFIWGSSFLLIVLSLQGFEPVTVVWGRVSLAAIALIVGLLATGGKLPSGRREWLWCAFLGFIGLAVPFNLIAWSLQTVPSGVVAVLIAAIPLFTLALTRIIFGDHITPARWAGFGIGLAGLALLSGPDAIAQIGANAQAAGQIACLLASLSFAVSAITVRAMPKIPPLSAVTGMHICAAVMTLPVGLTHLPEVTPGLTPVIALCFLGVVQTGFAQFLRFTVIRRAGIVFASTVGYMIPVWAGILGVILLDEPVTLSAIGAYVLIVCGLVLARPRRTEPVRPR